MSYCVVLCSNFTENVNPTFNLMLAYTAATAWIQFANKCILLFVADACFVWKLFVLNEITSHIYTFSHFIVPFITGVISILQDTSVRNFMTKNILSQSHDSPAEVLHSDTHMTDKLELSGTFDQSKMKLDRFYWWKQLSTTKPRF